MILAKDTSRDVQPNPNGGGKISSVPIFFLAFIVSYLSINAAFQFEAENVFLIPLSLLLSFLSTISYQLLFRATVAKSKINILPFLRTLFLAFFFFPSFFLNFDIGPWRAFAWALFFSLPVVLVSTWHLSKPTALKNYLIRILLILLFLVVPILSIGIVSGLDLSEEGKEFREGLFSLLIESPYTAVIWSVSIAFSFDRNLKLLHEFLLVCMTMLLAWLPFILLLRVGGFISG